MKIASNKIIPYWVYAWLPFDVQCHFMGTNSLVVPTLNGFGVLIKNTSTGWIPKPINRTIDNDTSIPWFKCRTLCK